MPRPRQNLTAQDEDLIRRTLNMAPDEPFKRCVGRSDRRKKEFEKAGDYSHSGKGHACDECRCGNIAGSGTAGDCYGLGRHDLGHYGTGLCVRCERHIRPSSAKKKWVEDMNHMLAKGSVAVTPVDYEREIEAKGKNSQARLDIFSAVSEMQNLMDDFKERLSPEYNERRIQALEQIYSRLEDLGPEDDRAVAVLKDTQNVVAGYIDSNGLTEKGGRGPVPISDATLHKLTIDRVNAINSVARTVNEFSKELHIPVDVLNVMLVRIMQLLQEICMTPDEYSGAVKKLRTIVNETRSLPIMAASVMPEDQ